MAQRMREEESRSRLATTLVTAYALLALALASLGLHAVLSYWVAQRRREIGIRMAMGAGRGAILRNVLRGGVPAIAAGIAIGMAGSFAAARTIEAALYGVDPLRPQVHAAAALVIATAALLACIVPAWRAARLEPTVVLRE